MMRGVRVARQQIEHFLPIPDASGLDLMAEHGLGIWIVKPLVEPELRIASRRANRPASEALGHFNDILLRISAIDAQGVQFHQFPAIVFVKAASLLLLLITGDPLRHAAVPTHGATGA